MNYLIEIPNEVPPSLNKSMKWHYRKKTEERNTWAEMIFVTAGRTTARQLRTWSGLKTRMKVRVTICHPKLYDRDNAQGGCKSVIFDALRQIGFIHDDSEEFLDQDVTQVKSKVRKTMIEIEPAS